MADIEQTINEHVEITAEDKASSVLDKVNKKASKLEKTLAKTGQSLDSSMETVVKHFGDLEVRITKLTEKLNNAATAIKSVGSETPFVNTEKAHSAMKGKGFSLIQTDKSSESYKRATDSYIRAKAKAERESAKKAKAEADNYDRILKIQEETLRIRDDKNKAKVKSLEAYSKMVDKIPDVEFRKKVEEAKIKHWENIDENRKKRNSLGSSGRYQMGIAGMQMGQTISNASDTWAMKTVGGAISSASAFLVNPALGAASSLKNLGQTISNFAQECRNAFGEIQKLKINLSVVYGTDSMANNVFDQLKDYALKSPFSVGDMTEMAILLRQSGVYADDLMHTIKMIGDVSAGNNEKMKRIANNYAQIQSIGKASMLDMRQFAYAGLPIYKAVAEELKVSQSTLRTMISDGKVTSDVIEKVFNNLTSTGGVFANATQKGAKGYAARIQNMKDATTLSKASLGEYFLNSNLLGLGTLLSTKGDQTGANHNISNSLIDLQEGLSTALRGWADGKNLDHILSEIKKQNKDIDYYKKMMKYSEEKGDKNAREFYENMYYQTLDRLSPYERMTYMAKAVDRYNDDFNAIHKDPRYEQAKNFNSIYGFPLVNYRLSRDIPGREIPIKKLMEKTDHASDFYALFEDAGIRTDTNSINDILVVYSHALKLNRDFSKKLKKLKKEKFTDVQYDSWNHSKFLEFQNRGQTYSEKKLNDRNSGNSVVSAILEKLSQTEEARKAELEKELKRQQEIIDFSDKLKLAGSTDKKGDKTEDFNLFNIDDAEILAKGIEEALITVGDKIEFAIIDQKGESSEELTKEFNDRISELSNNFSVFEKYFQSSTFDSLDVTQKERLNDYIQRGKDILSDDKLSYRKKRAKLSNYGKQMEEAQTIFENDGNASKEQKKAYSKFFNGLSMMFGHLNVNLGAAGVTLPEEKEKNKAVKIETLPALWKVILGNATGFNPEYMKDKKSSQIIEAYKDDRYGRNISDSVFTQLAKESWNTSQLQSLISYNGKASTLQTGKVEAGGNWIQQIDWRKTAQSVREFVLAMKASAATTNAYRTSIENQLTAFEELTAKQFTTTETRLGEGSGFTDQMVNAFDGKMVLSTKQDNEKFKKYAGQEIYAKDGKAFIKDENGNFTKEIGLLSEVNVSIKSMKEAVTNMTDEMRKQLKESAIPAFVKDTQADLSKNYAEAFIQQQLFKQSALQGFDTSFMTSEQMSNFVSKIQESALGDAPLAEIGTAEAESQMRLLTQAIAEATENFKALNSSSRESIEAQKSANAMKVARDLFNEKPQSALDMFAGVDKNGNSIPEQAMASALGFSDANYGDVKSSYLDIKRSNELGDLDTIEARLKEGGENAGITTEEAQQMGLSDAQIEALDNTSLEEQVALLEDVKKNWDEINGKTAGQELLGKAVSNTMKNFAGNVGKAGREAAKKSFLSSFETLGECLVTGDNAAEALTENLKKAGLELMGQIGDYMVQAGLSIAASAAAEKNWGLVAAGLGLAAAGGIASGVANALGKEDEASNEKDDEYQKLMSLKSQLADLLAQARRDAIYYENELRHQTALSANESLSSIKVNDAIITPNGNIVSTHPDDYLIATKTPGSLVGNGVSPNVNVQIVNNSGESVAITRTKQTSNGNELDFVAIIEKVAKRSAGEFIASSESDSAFMAREIRQNGYNILR